MNEKRCDIIIPVYNRPKLTKDCLESIFCNTDTPYGLILVDNGSDGDTRGYLESVRSSRENVELVRNEINEGWVKAVNKGIGISEAPYICMMNNDTVVRTHGWLGKLISILECNADIGMVSPVFEVRAQFQHNGPFIETDYCRGHCVVIKRDVVNKIGRLDEAFGMGYYDDVDYSLAAQKAGYRCVMANEVVVEHVRNSTFSSVLSGEKVSELQGKNRKHLESKWGRRLRLVFVASGDEAADDLKELLFNLARRGHYIYIWNTGKVLNLAHTNIVENRFPGILSPVIFPVMIAANRRKNINKRYDKVFYLNSGLSADAIKTSVESMSRA